MKKWQRCLRLWPNLHPIHSKNRIQFSSKLILWFGDSQVKYVKALTHLSQKQPPQNLKNNKRQARKWTKTRKAITKGIVDLWQNLEIMWQAKKAHNKTQRILTKLVIKEESKPQKLVKVNGSKVPQCRKQFANHYESNFEMKCNVQKKYKMQVPYCFYSF